MTIRISDVSRILTITAAVALGIVIFGCTPEQWGAGQSAADTAAGMIGEMPAPSDGDAAAASAAEIGGAIAPVAGAAFGPMGALIGSAVGSLLTGLATWLRTRKTTAAKIVSSIEKAKDPASGTVDWDKAGQLQTESGVRTLVRAVR